MISVEGLEVMRVTPFLAECDVSIAHRAPESALLGPELGTLGTDDARHRRDVCPAGLCPEIRMRLEWNGQGL